MRKELNLGSLLTDADCTPDGFDQSFSRPSSERDGSLVARRVLRLEERGSRRRRQICMV
jgi:hypothetical protein